MRSPHSSNDRKARPQYRNLLKDRISRQQPQPKKPGWLATLGRALRDNAALIAALLALAGVLITQYVTTTNTQKGLTAQRVLEEERTLEAEWQTYLDDMGTMILDERDPLPEAKADSAVAGLGQAKTITILERLDAASEAPDTSDAQRKGLLQRKALLLQFLKRAHLIDRGVYAACPPGSPGAKTSSKVVINLAEANLRKAYLSHADLGLIELYGVDLTGADLREAILTGTNLTGAKLREADLSGANLVGANLSGADLSGATGVTTEEVEEKLGTGGHIQGATMPDGTVHEAELARDPELDATLRQSPACSGK